MSCGDIVAGYQLLLVWITDLVAGKGGCMSYAENKPGVEELGMTKKFPTTRYITTGQMFPGIFG